VEVLTTVTNALIVGAVGLLLAALSKGIRSDLLRLKADTERGFTKIHEEIVEARAELRGELAEVRSDLRGELAEVRSDLRGELAEVRTEIRELRSDLTQVALAVGARPRAGHGS
jgi:chromosome segregation ATPase